MEMEEEKSRSKGTVLVVDDSPSNLNLLSAMLRKNGYEVRPAISSTLALQFLEVSLPDLILLDIRMPEMDGYQLCTRLKARERTRDIPVIFISALGEVVDKVRAFAAGGVDYITKPFQFEEVLARVGTHISLRAAQKALIQSERMAALGKLSQTVAHEIRNPVTVIGGFARRARNQISVDDPVQKILSVIIEEAEKLESMVAEIEKYCRLREPTLEPVRLEAIMGKVLLALSDRLEGQGIDVQRSGSTEAGEILGDEELLELALHHVVLNAAEAMPKGGTLVVTVNPQSDGLVLSIKDSGPAIPPEMVGNVFEPFFASKTRGSGLRLALARRIIEEQSGEIACHSSPESGTEVRIKMH